MKQLLILSGKGGTGKTTIASSFIELSNAKVYADCDVDAPNLHLIRGKDNNKKNINSVNNFSFTESDYYAMPKAEINNKYCKSCGKCKEKCRFNAIEIEKDCCNIHYHVNTFACEGCGVCEYVCPEKAIKLKPVVAGNLMLYKKPDEVFSTAKLKIGSGTSGKLVAAVKKQMMDSSRNLEKKDEELNNADCQDNDQNYPISIVDGSPGIGCPVISSLSGVDMVLIVAEPSMSGISDMKRIIKTAAVFGTKSAVCINKYNTNVEQTAKIKEFCEKFKIPFVGKVPFDKEAVHAINKGLSVVETECEAAIAIKEVYKNTMEILFKK